MFGVNRRRFFAAILAPLVVPWKAGQVSLIDQLDRVREALPAVPWPRRFDHARIERMNRRMNELHNQRIDNIVLNCTSEDCHWDPAARFERFDLDDRSLWGKRLR